MITLELFERYIAAKRRNWARLKALREAGIDCLNFLEPFEAPEAALFEALFSPAQRETIVWWLFDSPKGIEGDPTEPGMREADGTPIHTRNARELWEYLQGEGSNG